MPRHLVVQLARFGDLLQSKRLVASLCALGETHLCVDRSLASLARIVYPDVQVHALAAHAAASPEEVFSLGRETLAELQRLDFDLVCNVNYSGLNLALAGLFAPEIVRGHAMVEGQPLRSRWTELGFRWTRRRQSSPVNLVDFWAWLLQRPLPGGEINPPAKGGGGGVGVVLSGREARRSLPMEVLSPLVRSVMHQAGSRRAVLLGSKAEQPAARAFLREAPTTLRESCEDLSGKTDWAGLVEVVQGLDLVLTPDTGIMHLAAHLGTPTLACFLSSAWAWETGPYGKGHLVLQALQDCSPCIEQQPCHNDLQCLPPFAAPELLWFVAKGGLDRPAAAPLPAGLALLAGGFDDFGLTFTPLAGEDPHATERGAQRALLRELRTGAAPLPQAREARHPLYQERDWMLAPRP